MGLRPPDATALATRMSSGLRRPSVTLDRRPPPPLFFHLLDSSLIRGASSWVAYTNSTAAAAALHLALSPGATSSSRCNRPAVQAAHSRCSVGAQISGRIARSSSLQLDREKGACSREIDPTLLGATVDRTRRSSRPPRPADAGARGAHDVASGARPASKNSRRDLASQADVDQGRGNRDVGRPTWRRPGRRYIQTRAQSIIRRQHDYARIFAPITASWSVGNRSRSDRRGELPIADAFSSSRKTSARCASSPRSTRRTWAS